jgi:hypothetical protein
VHNAEDKQWWVIESGQAPLHAYQRQGDTLGHARDSYIIDVRRLAQSSVTQREPGSSSQREKQHPPW